MIGAARSARIKAIGYRCAVYAIALYFLTIAQVTFFSKINIFGAVPDLSLAAIALLCIKEDHKVCSVCGIISGFLYTALGGSEIPLYIIFSFLCAYIVWIAAQRSFGKNYLSFLAVCLLCFSLKALFNIAEASLFSSTFAIVRVSVSIVIPEFLSSMLFCSVSYVIFNGISALINKKFKK